VAETNITTESVNAFLKQFAASYSDGGEEFFDSFTDDASFFALSVPARIDSTEQYREGFEKDLAEGRERRTQILSPSIRMLGESAALVTFHNRIHVNKVTTNNRITMVVEAGAKGLQVSHLHVSPMTTPTLPGLVPDKDVAVLEERVATAIGAVGTPK